MSGSYYDESVFCFCLFFSLLQHKEVLDCLTCAHLLFFFLPAFLSLTLSPGVARYYLCQALNCGIDGGSKNTVYVKPWLE